MKQYKQELKNNRMTYAELAHRIGRSEVFVKNVLRGKSDPRLGDCYKMLHEVGIEAERLPEFFPAGRLKLI